MRRRAIAGPFVVLCLAALMFVFPVIAQAAPWTATVGGTITKADTGAVFADSHAVIYYWDADNAAWVEEDHDVADALGKYSFTLNGVDAIPSAWKIRVQDPLGLYAGFETAQFTIANLDAKTFDVKLSKDSTAPERFDWWGGTNSIVGADGYFSNDDKIKQWIEVDDGVYEPRDIDWDFSPEGSGIATITYTLNAGPEASVANPRAAKFDGSKYYSTEVTVTAEGVNTLTFWGTDRAGNVSKKKTIKIRIDRTAPVTTYDMATAKGGSVTLTPTDALSGADATFWRYGATGNFTFGTVVPVPTAMATVQFFSVDTAGNVEAVKSLNVWPAAKLNAPKASTSKPKNNKTFYTTGSVSGRTAAKGEVQCWRVVKAKWYYVGKRYFTEASNGKYKVSWKLKTGTYKFKALYGKNTATVSDPPVVGPWSAKYSVK